MKNILIGFGLVVAVLVGVGYILVESVNIFKGLDSQLKASTIQVVGIIGVAIVTYFANKSIERKRTIEASLREQKRKMYDDYIKFFYKVFHGERIGDKPTEDEIMKFFADKNPELTTYGSNAVIKKLGEMRLKLSNNPEAMFVVEDVMVEMRKDLGHSKWGYTKGDILRLFINDIDNYLGKRKTIKSDDEG